MSLVGEAGTARSNLVIPKAEGLKDAASLIEIPLKDEGRTGPFVFTESQEQIAKELETGESIIILKPRQIHMTTLCLFWIFNLALCNPSLSFGIAFQDQKLAREKLAIIKDWCGQLGIPLKINNADKIKLFNDAEIHADGARKGEAAGEDSTLFRGQTLSAVLLSEAAYYRNKKAYASVKAAVGEGPIVIESTAAGPNGLFYDLWVSPRSQLKKVFLGVETQQRYQAPPSSISDETWDLLQREYGFTSRPHAAWWWEQLGEFPDVVSLLREYPVTAYHPFQVSDSRWIQRDPEVLEPIKVVDGVEFFKLAEPGHRYVAGVDVSAGTGRDYSTIALLDRSTKHIVASFDSNTATITELMQACKVMADNYPVDVFVIEADGVGGPAIQRANEFHLPVKVSFTRDTDPYGAQRARLLEVKRGVEAGILYGPMILKEEADSLHLNHKDRFCGRKDMCCAIGLAALYIADNPYSPPEPVVDSMRFYVPRRNGNAWA